MCDLSHMSSGFITQFSNFDFSHPYQYGLLIGASILASPHCALMCGPIVALENDQYSNHRLLVYNGFRLLSYSIAGALAAILGQSLLHIMGRELKLMLGIVLLIYAIAQIFLTRRQADPTSCCPSKKPASCGGCSKTKQHSRQRYVILGVVSALIPCMSLTPMFVLASLQDHFLKGAGMMFVFGLGTLPVMSGVGWSYTKLGRSRWKPMMSFTHPLLCVIVAVHAFGWII